MAYSQYTTINADSLLNAIYPVGSIYISVNNVSPASFLGGTWSQLSAGYALWTATSGAGETINAGLPNISGYFDVPSWTWSGGALTPFRGTDGKLCTTANSSGSEESFALTGSLGTHRRLNINASGCDSIYGNSATVQPPAYKIYAWKRTA